MTVLEFLKDNIVILDGGMGTLLQERGLGPGELPESWNIKRPEDVTDIHRAYFDAGSNIVVANTFGANSLKLGEKELSDTVTAALDNVKRAREKSSAAQEKFVGLDVGSLGKLLKPYGDFEFEEAVEIYAKTIRAGVRAGAELIFIETMNDSLDTKACVLAAKENSSLPLFVSNAYGEDGKLMTGADPEAMVTMLEGLGVDALGVNCSLGPKELGKVVAEYLRVSSTPVLLKPNAGLPRSEGGKTVYDIHPQEFCDQVAEYVRMGVRLCGGCCGTSPEYIKGLSERVKAITPVPVSEKSISAVSSYTHPVYFGKSPVLIGERINPTGKKRFKQALRDQDMDHILGEGLRQEEKGAQVLDVNVGIPEIDEPVLLKKVCYELQSVTDLPLQIDTTDPVAMEAALRQYNGKAMINSVNGKEEVMSTVFPLVKKYGGLVVCLTLDEDGIPEDADKRVEIAKRIIKRAEEYGIKKKDLIFDPLAMSVSADPGAALATLKALERISKELSCLTILGVSNISFGLPCREVITASFFTSALERGLSAAIMNPGSAEMMKAYYSFRTLHGLDENCRDYIEKIESYAAITAPADRNVSSPVRTDTVDTGEKGAASAPSGDKKIQDAGDTHPSPEDTALQLRRAIIRGLKDKAAGLTAQLLEREEPLSIVNGQIIPALDTVGEGFEKKTMYLPQLLMSAEASQAAFEQIKRRLKESGESGPTKGKFVIATVRGDVHDIGKNIVKLILENYGFEVIDLGKDVPAEVIAERVKKEKAPLAGLSALMTTTVPSMEETIKLLRKEAPWVKVVVGGAVLTQEYADKIGADHYAKDAMETVRYSLKVTEETAIS